jgi:hypothetical protein
VLRAGRRVRDGAANRVASTWNAAPHLALITEQIALALSMEHLARST